MIGRRFAWMAPLLRWRDRLLSNPDFQRRSLRLPLVRMVARRRMRALFDLCSGFVYSQVLLACTRLQLFELLADGPRSAAALTEALELPRASLDRLLEAAESLQLVERRGRDQFGLGPLGAALLGNPAVAMMIEHHSAFYADMSDPLALLRGDRQDTELGRFWAYSTNTRPSELSAGDTADYTALMAASQALIADQVLSAYPVHNHRRLLDVGGGDGTFALAAMQQSARLEACVFDLPAVSDSARQRFERAGFGNRGRACGGDFLTDPLPSGYDLVSLVRILHDHDDNAVRQILQSVRRAIAPDGLVLIAEPMLGTRGAQPVAAAYFGFYLMAMGQGKPRTPAAIESLLRGAGFRAIRSHRTHAPLLVCVVSARPQDGNNIP